MPQIRFRLRPTFPRETLRAPLYPLAGFKLPYFQGRGGGREGREKRKIGKVCFIGFWGIDATEDQRGGFAPFSLGGYMRVSLTTKCGRCVSAVYGMQRYTIRMLAALPIYYVVVIVRYGYWLFGAICLRRFVCGIDGSLLYESNKCCIAYCAAKYVAQEILVFLYRHLMLRRCRFGWRYDARCCKSEIFCTFGDMFKTNLGSLQNTTSVDPLVHWGTCAPYFLK